MISLTNNPESQWYHVPVGFVLSMLVSLALTVLTVVVIARYDEISVRWHEIRRNVEQAPPITQTRPDRLP